MAFELGRITKGDLPFIFPNVHDDKLENRALFRTTRDYFYGVYKDVNNRKKVVGNKWVVDKERCAFMTNATATYRHNVGGETYFFGWEGGTAIITNRGYCLYEFYKVTDDLLPRLEQLKPLIAEGKSLESVGGRYYRAIPHVEFFHTQTKELKP